jgi:hypothetical protein
MTNTQIVGLFVGQVVLLLAAMGYLKYGLEKGMDALSARIDGIVDVHKEFKERVLERLDAIDARLDKLNVPPSGPPKPTE